MYCFSAPKQCWDKICKLGCCNPDVRSVKKLKIARNKEEDGTNSSTSAVNSQNKSWGGKMIVDAEKGKAKRTKPYKMHRAWNMELFRLPLSSGEYWSFCLEKKKNHIKCVQYFSSR